MTLPKPPHILVLDDHPELRELIVAAFMERGFSFSFAEDVNTAAGLTAAVPPDAIVVDPRIATTPAGREFMALAGARGAAVVPMPGSFAVLSQILPSSVEQARNVRHLQDAVGDALGSRERRLG